MVRATPRATQYLMAPLSWQAVEHSELRGPGRGESMRRRWCSDSSPATGGVGREGSGRPASLLRAQSLPASSSAAVRPSLARRGAVPPSWAGHVADHNSPPARRPRESGDRPRGARRQMFSRSGLGKGNKSRREPVERRPPARRKEEIVIAAARRRIRPCGVRCRGASLSGALWRTHAPGPGARRPPVARRRGPKCEQHHYAPRLRVIS